MQHNTEHFLNIFICIFYSEVQAVRSPYDNLGTYHLFNPHTEINYCLILITIKVPQISVEPDHMNSLPYTFNIHHTDNFKELCQHLQIHNNMRCITHYFTKKKKIYIMSGIGLLFALLGRDTPHWK